MDQAVKIEESETELAGEQLKSLDVMRSAEELHTKTEIRRSASIIGVDIKNEIDTDEQTESGTKNKLPRIGQEVMETAGVTFVCYHCEYAARSEQHLVDHMKVHRNRKYIYSCVYCDFRTNSGVSFTTHNKTHSSECEPFEAIYVKEENMDDDFSQGNTLMIDSETHVLNKTSSRDRKTHPSFIHECTKCTYKTSSTKYLKQHMVTHSNDRITSRCIYCDKTFVHKKTLHDHIVRKHPDFIASLSKKVYECTDCTFKTISPSKLKQHKVTHSDAADNNRITSRCNYCNKTFVHKKTLDDHIVRKHPDFIASVSKKVHECTRCNFKTISSSQLKRHMVTHPDIAGNRITTRCNYCNKTFLYKVILDDHIIQTHPDCIASVSSKIHECTQCTYKTTIANYIRDHLRIKHPELAGNRILSRCIYCNKSFIRKLALDEHIIKTHPDFIASVSSKIHECTQCAYKTTIASLIREHLMIKHPEMAGNGIFSSCIYCDKTFTRKQTLDEHIVRSHPDFIASLSRKVHECTKCIFKTTITKRMREHSMSKHPETTGNRMIK
ncbi:unnamed protein product [Callosobruchus maculatus]|uniref:C2H2-type domain-containing protein n=2 Tax=Callosobruchus maculatus TaxID=64391 RepID=A0A653BG63_CALMS|nr:unnamed protein product [Callosobruchus maculatus]